jgi:hypothetical protein
MPMTERARARSRECEWRTALDGVHAGNRAVAARIVAGATRSAVDVKGLAARWLQGGRLWCLARPTALRLGGPVRT